MSIIPTSTGRRGNIPQSVTSPRRIEAIEKVWTFLSGLVVKAFRFYGGSPAVGSILVATDTDGNATWSTTLPAQTLVLTAQTTSQTGTMIATATGEYLATMYLECTTAGAAGTLDGTLTITDDVGAATIAVVTGLVLNATGRGQGVVTLRCSGGGVDFTFTITGGVGGPQYAAYVSITKVR